MKKPTIRTSQTLIREEYDHHYGLLVDMGADKYERFGMADDIFFDQVRRKIKRIISRSRSMLRGNG